MHLPEDFVEQWITFLGIRAARFGERKPHCDYFAIRFKVLDGKIKMFASYI